MLPQVIANGLSLGAIYALFAIGYALIFRLNINNFAHGATAVVGAYIASLMHKTTDLPFVIVLSVAGAIGAVLSVLNFFIAIRPVLRQERWSTILVSTFALGIVIENVVLIAHGPDNFVFRDVFGPIKMFSFLGANLTTVQCVLFLTSMIILGLVLTLLKISRIGLRLVAIATDRELAETLGIDADLTILSIFAIAGILAGISGALICVDYDLDPTSGTLYLLKGYVAVVIGGNRIWSIVLAAYTVAILESVVGTYITTNYMFAGVCLTLIVFLVIRKSGFARNIVREA